MVASLALALLVAACAPGPTGGPSGPAGTPSGSGPERASSTPNTAADAASTTILAAARLGDATSLAPLESIRFTVAGVAAAAKMLASGVTGDALWAATYVYASSGSDPAPLRVVASATAASPSIRAMAAAGLVGRGDAAGFDVLISAIGGSDLMDGAAPAGAIWEFAGDVLERYTHAGFGPALAATAAQRATIQAQWKAWLDASRAKLRFDVASQLWVMA
jgi:hypothetical protein